MLHSLIFIVTVSALNLLLQVAATWMNNSKLLTNRISDYAFSRITTIEIVFTSLLKL